MTHPWFTGCPTPRVLAHRGFVTAVAARTGIAENSFAAVAEAHRVGARYIETDCRLTRDGVPVLFHDRDLARVTGDARPVSTVGVRDLERLMSARGGLVTLSQALEAFPALRWNIDVKSADAATAVGRTVAPHADRVLLTSFSDERRLAALRAAQAAGGERPATSPGRETLSRLLFALSLRSRPLVRRALRGVDALQIPPRHRSLRILSRHLIEAAHREGVEVHVWTIDDPDAMRRLVAAGVDGIVTDRADVALQAFRAPLPRV